MWFLSRLLIKTSLSYTVCFFSAFPGIAGSCLRGLGPISLFFRSPSLNSGCICVVVFPSSVLSAFFSSSFFHHFTLLTSLNLHLYNQTKLLHTLAQVQPLWFSVKLFISFRRMLFKLPSSSWWLSGQNSCTVSEFP